MAGRMQRSPIRIHSLPIAPLDTAFVGPLELTSKQHAHPKTSTAPVVLLHSFDSSCLEFRRLYPLLEAHTETWAVDLVSATTNLQEGWYVAVEVSGMLLSGQQCQNLQGNPPANLAGVVRGCATVCVSAWDH